MRNASDDKMGDHRNGMSRQLDPLLVFPQLGRRDIMIKWTPIPGTGPCLYVNHKHRGCIRRIMDYSFRKPIVKGWIALMSDGARFERATMWGAMAQAKIYSRA